MGPVNVTSVLKLVAKGQRGFDSEANIRDQFRDVLEAQGFAPVITEAPLGAGVGHRVDLILGVPEAVRLAFELKFLRTGGGFRPRLEFVNDIARLDEVVSAHPAARGYAILLTSDASIWTGVPTRSDIRRSWDELLNI